MRTRSLLLVIVVSSLATTACSGSSGEVGPSSGGGGRGGTPGGEALFAVSGEATPSSIYGVWGGADEENGLTVDGRMRFSADSITMAAQCTLGGRKSDVVSVTVRARISDDELAVLESAEDVHELGDVTCRATARPQTLKACDRVDGLQENCFVLDGLTLTTYGGSRLEKVEWTKLSD